MNVKNPKTVAPVRRQERGERRMAELLQAASQVFADTGYERATTNAIAKKAGVSPGTLYQFFPNKAAMAEALALRYTRELRAAQDAAFDKKLAQLPLKRMLDQVLDPFIDLHRKSPGFKELLAASAISPDLAGRIYSMEMAVQGRLEEIFAERRPRAAKAKISKAAEYSMQLFKALIAYAFQGNPVEQQDRIREAKLVFERYLEPLLGK